VRTPVKRVELVVSFKARTCGKWCAMSCPKLDPNCFEVCLAFGAIFVDDDALAHVASERDDPRNSYRLRHKDCLRGEKERAAHD